MNLSEQGMADPIERLVRLAYQSGASDIHIEPGSNGNCQVRVRLGGQLEKWDVLEGTLDQTVSRVKLKARMDIAERRLPQDGSFRVGSHEVLDMGQIALDDLAAKCLIYQGVET